MAKKSKKRHTVDKSFPGQASPMDVVNHPIHNLPDPVAGMTNPAAMAAMPGVPGNQSIY